MKLVTVMVVMLIIWCFYTVAVRHSALPSVATSAQPPAEHQRPRLARP